MIFKKLNSKIQEQFTRMCSTGKLFRVNVSGNEIWDKYISGFKPEQNPVFRDPNSSTHNCNNDKSFIRRYGNIVAIDESFQLMSLFDIEVSGDYIDTIPSLSSYVKSFSIIDVFVESYNFLDREVNWERVTKKQEAEEANLALTKKENNQKILELISRKKDTALEQMSVEELEKMLQ